MAAKSFVSTQEVTADSTPAPIVLTELVGTPGTFKIAVYNTGGVGASIVFADDAAEHSAYYFGPGVSGEVDGWTAGDVANGLWLYAASSADCKVTLRKVV